MKVFRKTLSFILAITLICTSIVFTGGGVVLAGAGSWANGPSYFLQNATPKAGYVLWMEGDITESSLTADYITIGVSTSKQADISILRYYGSGHTGTPAQQHGLYIFFNNQNATPVKLRVATIEEPAHIALRQEYVEDVNYPITTIYIDGIQVFRHVGSDANGMHFVYPLKDEKITLERIRPDSDGKTLEKFHGKLITPGEGIATMEKDFFANFTLKPGVEDVELTTGSGTIAEMLSGQEAVTTTSPGFTDLGITCPTGETLASLLSKVDYGSATLTLKRDGEVIDDRNTELKNGDVITLGSARKHTSNTIHRLSNDYTVKLTARPVITTTNENYKIDNVNHTISGVMAYSNVSDMIGDLTIAEGYRAETTTGLVKDGMKFTVTDGTTPIEYTVYVDKISYDYSAEGADSKFETAEYSVINEQDVLLIHLKDWTAGGNNYNLPYLSLGRSGVDDAYLLDKDADNIPVLGKNYLDATFTSGTDYQDLYILVDFIKHQCDAIYGGKRIGHVSTAVFEGGYLKDQTLTHFRLGFAKDLKATLDAYKVASKDAVLDDLISEKYNTISFTQSGNTYTASVIPYESSILKKDEVGNTLYFAEYTTDGELVQIIVDDTTETAKDKDGNDAPKFGFGKYSVDITPQANSNKIRAFFWDAELAPIAVTDYTTVSGLTLSQEEPLAASPALLSTALENPNYKGIITNETKDKGINMQVKIHSAGNEIKNSDSAVATAQDPSEYKLVVTLGNKTTGYVENKIEYNSLSQFMSIDIPSSDLEVGTDYRLMAELIDKSTGQRADRNIHTIRRRTSFADMGLEYYVDSTGRLIDAKTGKPEFYTFLYLGNDNEGDIPSFASGKYNSVMRYWNDAYDENKEPYGKPYGDEFFATVEAGNLGVIANMGYYGDDKDRNYSLDADTIADNEQRIVETWTSYLKTQDNLDMYYMGDEQKPQMRDRLRWRNDIVNDIDITRPTVFVDMRNDKNTIFGHNQTADIMALDVYMIKNNATNEFGRIGTQYTKPVKENFINKPVWAIHQAADYKALYPNEAIVTGGLPTEQQMLNIAMQSVVNGATGIGWYAYNAIKEGNDSAVTAQQLTKLNNVNAKLENLSDIIMSNETDNDIKVEISPYTWNGNPYTNHINYMVKSTDEGTYLFLVQTGMHNADSSYETEWELFGQTIGGWKTSDGGVTVTVKGTGISEGAYLLNETDNTIPSTTGKNKVHVSSSSVNSLTLVVPTYAVCVLKIK